MFLRINGHGRISTNPKLCERLAEGPRVPKTVIIVTIDEVLFHCGKAINRAKLWSLQARLDRSREPSLGEMKAEFIGVGPARARQMDENYARAVRENLYGLD